MSPRLDTRPAPLIPSLMLTLMLAGGLVACSGAPDMSALSTGTLTEAAPASTMETYARVARGANKCWFGAQGRYRSSHILYAEANPPASGGAAEIVVHERDRAAERPWGARAFRVVIIGSGGHASFDTENFRMPDGDAERMRREVRNWARDDLRCDGTGSEAIGPSPATTPIAPSAPLPPVTR